LTICSKTEEEEEENNLGMLRLQKIKKGNIMKYITLLAAALLMMNGCSSSAMVTPETDRLFTQKEWKAVNTNDEAKKEIFYEK